MLSLPRILWDGLILSAIATVSITLIFRLNPRLWLQDYPKDVQASQPPKTEQEKRLSLLVGIPFLLLLLGVPLVSTLALEQRSAGPVPFWALFAQAFGVLLVFNLFDWLILDWLLFCTITPSFMVYPGTAGMAGYKDYRFHFIGFLKGCVFSLVGGLVIAAIVAIV